jgi:hypothetical protein
MSQYPHIPEPSEHRPEPSIAGPLDTFSGSWRVSLTPDASARQAGAEPFDDILIFTQGALTSEACVPYGFKPANYDLSDSGHSFQALLESPTDGRSLWTGHLEGDQLVGRNQWTRPDGTIISFTFTGTRP